MEQQNVSSSGANAQDDVQTESERQSSHGLDDLFDDPGLGGLGDAGQPGQLHGGYAMAGFNSNWSLAPDIAGRPVHQSPELGFGASHTPSMNQGFNPSNFSLPVAQNHLWPSLDPFGAAPLFNSTGYPSTATFTGLGQQKQAAGNNQSTVPSYGARVAGGRQCAPIQQSATHRAPIGVQSPQVNRQALPFAEMPTGAPNAPNPVNDGENIPIPDWIVPIKPLPQAGNSVITLRREAHIALDIIFERLPRRPPVGCSGIRVPATASVKNNAFAIVGTPLEFRIRVYGANNRQLYESVCASCGRREGKRRGIPSLIDFHAECEIIGPKDGKIRVDFTFCCYSKCNQESSYFLEVVIFEDIAQNRILAQYELPFSYHVVTRSPQVQGKPATTKGKRTRRDMEGTSSTANDRNVRIRRDEPLPRDPPGYEPTDHPMPAFNPRNAPQDRGDSSSSASPVAAPLPIPWNAGPNPEPISARNPPNPPQQAIAPPRTDGEPAPTLTEVNPESGSITGGARIWLKGIDFPALFPLFARFGTAVVPTTFSASNLLACHLPPATAPCVVDVTLSKHPQPSAPEYGTSIAKFNYLGDQDQLIPILLRIQGQGYPEFSPVLQALLTALKGPQPNRGIQGGSHGAGPREDPIETGLIDALSSLQARPNFHEIVSTTNDYSQTLAHLSIFYAFPSLLGCLVEWGINLTTADVNGLTALHCAYMKGDLESVRVLRRGGAPESLTDKLGRTPSELRPEGLEGFEEFDSDIDVDAEVAFGLDAEVYPEADDIDEQLALGEQFSALDLDDDNDSGHGQSDSEDDASDEEEDPDGMAVDSFPGGEEGASGGGGVASGSGGGQIASSSKEPAINIMNQLLLEKNKRKKKKNRGPRMLPDTPYDAAISSVSKKLRETEAELDALDFLTRGIFPDGTISLVSLKTEMTADEVGEFQFAPGTLKYHGLLRRDREIVYCRLCPEDNQLDFKDPEEALHHMTKDHFDMGYSCDCGCNETYWTSADWRRHRKRKGLSLTPPQMQAEPQAQVVVAN